MPAIREDIRQLERRDIRRAIEALSMHLESAACIAATHAHYPNDALKTALLDVESAATDALLTLEAVRDAVYERGEL